MAKKDTATLSDITNEPEVPTEPMDLGPDDPHQELWRKGAEPEAEETAVLEAIEGEEMINLDVDLLVEILNSISGGFKQLKGLFNPADSRGDAFINQINLLDMQIEGLVAAILPFAEDIGDPINQEGLK